MPQKLGHEIFYERKKFLHTRNCHGNPNEYHVQCLINFQKTFGMFSYLR